MSEEAGGTSLGGEVAAVEQGAVEAAQAEQAAQSSWLDSFSDPEARSYVEKTGYKSLDDVANAARSGRQLISKIQGDPERVALMPKDWDDPVQVQEFYGKLGRPEDISGYEFSDADGNPIQDPVVDWYKEFAFANGLSPDRATAGLQGFQELAQQIQQQQSEAQEAEWQTSVERDLQNLKREWGNGYEAKIAGAKAALQQFPELNSPDIERALGVDAYYKLMAGLGEKVGEHKAVGLGNKNADFGRTPDQARSELQELQGNKEWMEAFLNRDHPGHAAALAKRDRLMQDAYPN